MFGNSSPEKLSYSNKPEEGLLICLLLAFTLIVRLFFLQMINVGPDEIDYWFSAKRLIGEGAYPVLMHRTIRWPIILSVAFSQLILGTNPVVYYATPVLNSLIQSVLLFKIGKMLFDRSIGFYSSLSFTIWPYMWRTGSQIRPAIFSLTFVLFSLFFLVRYMENTKRSQKEFLLSILFLFIAYLTKITNIYFVPSFMILIAIRKENWNASLKYGSILIALYLFEHLFYFIFTGNALGRLGIIANFHLASDYAENLPKSLMGLFKRYTILELPWKFLFLLYLLSTVSLLRRKTEWIKEITIIHGIFFLLLTFMVSSLHPVKPVESFLDRYFITCLPTMCLVCITFIFKILPGKIVNMAALMKTQFFWTPLFLSALLLITLLPLPSGTERFFTPLNKLSRHPLALVTHYADIIESLDLSKTVVLSINSKKPIDTFNRLFYDNPSSGRRAQVIQHQKIKGDDFYLIFNKTVDLLNLGQDDQILECDRFNFSIKYVPLKEISQLKE